MRHHFQSRKSMLSLFRKHFLTGVFVLIPFLVVAWILGKVFSALWTLHSLIPEEWKPIYHFDPFTAHVINVAITIGITAIFAVSVSLLGWFSKRIIGVRILRFMDKIVQRIPVVRAVYSSLNQLLSTVASGEKQQFSRVVYVEYPRKGSWTLAFVTGSAGAPTGENPDESYLNLYVPTTPNPTSGFHLILPEKDVRDTQMTVEAAFKTILSLGIASDRNPEA